MALITADAELRTFSSVYSKQKLAAARNVTRITYRVPNVFSRKGLQQQMENDKAPFLLFQLSQNHFGIIQAFTATIK